MAQYDVISFLSDLGIDDESVGVCKAIMMQQAPNAQIIDITHQIKPFDVRQGALALTRAIQFLPSGVVLAAVDPGAPRDQRYIAVELENSIFVGPDNGILAPAAQLLGEPIRVHELTNPEYRIEAPGGVFAARDIMAPAAGVIASGVDIAELGNAIPLEQLVPGMLQLSRHDEGGAFLGEVWSVDRFENIQTNITPEEMTATGLRLGDTVIVRIGQNDFMVKFVERYADLQKSQLGLLVDSTGMLSIAKNLDFAARELGVSEGSALAIMPQGATITGRDITVEAVQALAPTLAPEQAISPVAPNPASSEEDNSSGGQAIPAPIAPAPVQYEAPISPVAPVQNEVRDVVIPETTPIAFDVTLPGQVEPTPQPTSVQYETPAPQPLEYDVPTPMPDPVFEPTQNSGSFSSTPARTESEVQESNPYAQLPVVLPPHPLDQPAQQSPQAAPAPAPAPAPVQYEAPQVQAPHPLDQTPAPVQSEAAQNVFSSPTYVPQDLAPAPAPSVENTFIDQFTQQAPAPAAPTIEPAPAPVQYEAPAAPQAPVQYEGSVQPQTYVQEPVAPLQPVAPQQEPQIPMPPQAQPAPQAPAPQAPAQTVDQIPSGNVFDLFKIDAESDSDNEDPFSPAQQ